MAKGKTKVNYLGREGIVQSADSPDYGFVYTSESSVKDPKYNIGDRVVLPDGRVFRYAKSVGACYTYQLAMFDGALTVSTNPLQQQAVGDKVIKIDAGGAAAVAEDELRGGYIVIYGTDNSDVQNRGIIGNTLADSNGYTYVYLDAPLNVAITTDTYLEVLPNPYRRIALAGAGTDTYRSVAGLPAVEVTAADKYFWVQTWGICAIAPGESAVCDAANERSVCADVSVGALHESYDATYGIPVSGQVVGFGVDRTSSGSGAVFFMLQISP